MHTPSAIPLFLLVFSLAAGSAQGAEKRRRASAAEIPIHRGADVLIVGDSYSAGQVGPYLEKQFAAQGHKVGRYGISSSWIKHWVEKNPDDKQIGPGVGVDWAAPGMTGAGHAPADFPKLAEIEKGEAKNARKIVIILGTNGYCNAGTLPDATKLAQQATQSVPGIQCLWVGPKLFSEKKESQCFGDQQKQKAYAQQLGAAVQAGGCRFVDSTGLAPAGTHPHDPHNGDRADEWMKAVWPKVQ